MYNAEPQSRSLKAICLFYCEWCPSPFFFFSLSLIFLWSCWFFPYWFVETKANAGGTSGKESACQWRRSKRCSFDPWAGKIPWRRKWQSTPVFLPGESHGRRGLVGNSQWDHRVGYDWRNWVQYSTYVCPLPLKPPSHLPPHPTHLGCHRAPGRASCAIQQLPTSYLFYTW